MKGPVLNKRFGLLTLVFVCFWSSVILFAALANQVRSSRQVFADSILLNWLHSVSSPLLDNIAILVTTMGSAEFVTLLGIFLISYFLYNRQRTNAALLILGVGGAAIANLFLKLLFQRARPDLWPTLITVTDHSFPSGHAMASSALAFCLIVIFWHTKWRRLVLVAGIIYIVLVGLSRLYLGVHFPSDVVAGWCVSFVWVAIITSFFRKFRSSKKKA